MRPEPASVITTVWGAGKLWSPRMYCPEPRGLYISVPATRFVCERAAIGETPLGPVCTNESQL